MNAQLGVVVVHFGSPQPTRRCVASVLGDPSPVERLLVVVDNSGNLPELANAVLLRCPDNPGFGEGANRGIRLLADRGVPAVVVLNHDVEIMPGFFSSVVRHLQREGVGAVGGPLFFPDGRRLWAAGGAVLWPLGTVRQFRSLRRAWRARPVGFLPGAALGLRWDAFWQVGGFDPRFFVYHEDLDLCLRLRRAGWQLWYAPGAAAIHHLGSATGSYAYSPLYLEHLARTRLRPFRPLALRLWLASVHSLYVAGRWAFLRLHGEEEKAAALWRGHRAALATVGEGPLAVVHRRRSQHLLEGAPHPG